MIASTLAAFVASAGMCAVSRLNYPGAKALERLHELGASSGAKGVKRVHLDQLTCMTGVTRFLQQTSGSPPPVLGKEVEGEIFWIYDKTEDQPDLIDKYFWEKMDYALAEWPETVLGQWRVLETVDGFAGLKIVKPSEGDSKTIHEGIDWGSWSSKLRELLTAGNFDPKEFSQFARGIYYHYETITRSRATGGWWLEARMEPQIRIMERIRHSPDSEGNSNAEDDADVAGLAKGTDES